MSLASIGVGTSALAETECILSLRLFDPPQTMTLAQGGMLIDFMCAAFRVLIRRDANSGAKEEIMRRVCFGAIASIACTNLAFACGTERWPVKIGIDQDVGKVSTEAQPTTIAELTSLIAPQHPTGRENKRYSPVELTTYEVTGTLTLIKKEADQDYHLVIADDSITMIVEAPNPQCAQGSRFLGEITQVRQAIDAKFGPIEQRLTPNVRVTVIGVGFFDKLHDQDGIAKNGIEIHPITEIAFH